LKSIGKYEVRGLLGRGGMAKVFKVAMPGSKRLAALKLFQPRPELLLLLPESELRERFVEEARILSGLEHPNLVEVCDRGEHEGQPFYVMDYLCRSLGQVIGEGGDLEEPSRKLTIEQAVDFGLQTLAGLDCLHQAGLVHRDIKPDNILLTAQDQVRLADLGLARSGATQENEPVNLLVGSPFYAAPEQEEAPDKAGPSADVYSLGVTLQRMLTGLVKLAPGQKPSSINLDLYRQWDDFLGRAMSPLPEGRFASAHDMAAVLEELGQKWQQRKEAACALAPKQAPQARPGRRRSKPIKVSPGQAGQAFALNKDWSPASYSGGGLQEHAPGVLYDPASNLAWQRGGSSGPLSWREANAYCESLSRENWAGLNGWRLPTVDELLSILRPPARAGDLCVQSAFDPRQRWLWSADRATYVSAWYVSVDMGFVSWQDFSCPFYARAVCSLA
jgi:serine/threonine protein kinase